MFILIEAGTPADVLKKIQLAMVENIGPDAKLVTPETYSFASGEYVFGVYEVGGAEDPTHSRWFSLYSASKGGRLYSNTPDADNPLFVKSVPVSDEHIQMAIVDALYAKSRAQYFATYGVNYIGRVTLDPRTIILLDNKGKNKLHSSVVDGSLDALYNSLPADWWGSAGFVSTGNIEKLGTFMEGLPYSVPLAYSDGAKAKLKYLDVVHAIIPTPPSQVSLDYGIKIREVANRLSNT